MQERRLTSRLLEYWDNIRKDRTLPDINSFNSSAVEDVWGFCIRLAIQPGKGDTKTYRYEYIGDRLREAYGADISGKIASAKNRQLPGFKLLAQADGAVAGHETTTGHGQFINKDSKLVKYRNCVLPFGKDNGEVSHVIIGMSWKAF